MLRRRSSIALCIPLLGCLNGDFGRVRQSLVFDDIHNWVGQEAALQQGIPPSAFRLTDEEHRLRDLAYPLIEPPFERQRWYSVLNEYGLTGYFQNDWWIYDPTAYAVTLVGAATRSTSTLYARLNDDIRNDIERIEPFCRTARKVTDLDGKREKSLAYVSLLSPQEVADAQRRVAENALTVAWVNRSLLGRAASYTFALERLIISTPSTRAVDVERSITLLKFRITQSCFAAATIPGAPPPPVIVSK